MTDANSAGAAMAASAGGEVLPPGVKRIVGPTILMGDGAYFDYDDPASAPITIDDVAYGLAFTARFRGQTRTAAGRVLYSVAEHCVRLATQMLADGHGREAAYAGLMHELGEVPCGDMPAPMKLICPDFKVIERRCEAALFAQFGVDMSEHATVKTYDLRMLATEKRDLMPQSGRDRWSSEDCDDLEPYRPFAFTIEPWSPAAAAGAFLRAYRDLRP